MVLLRRRGERTRRCRGNIEIGTKIGVKGGMGGAVRVMTVTVTVSGMEGGSATFDSELRHLVWK